MPPKRGETRSTISNTEKPHASHSISEDSDFDPDESEALLSNEPPNDAGKRRQFWIVQLRNFDGQLKEVALKVRDVWKLKNGAQVVVPFDGSQPSGTDALGLLGGFLGQLGSNHKLLPISYECWPKVYSKCKEDVWDREIKEKIDEIESQGTTSISPSPNDSLGQVFGKEHPGPVRGVGSGVCPSQLFGSYQRYNAASRFFGVETNPQVQKELDDLKLKLELETQQRITLEERFNVICKKLNLPTSSEHSNEIPTTQPAPHQPSTSHSGA